MTESETWACREIVAASPKTAWGASWIINAPWAHPLWSQYTLHLYDLVRPIDGGSPVRRYLPEATHEFLLCAMDPKAPLVRGMPLLEQRRQHLQPPNYGYQLRADSDDAALRRIQAIVDEIVAQRLSPDTNWRDRWDRMFQDACPMVVNRTAEMLGGGAGYSRGRPH